MDVDSVPVALIERVQQRLAGDRTAPTAAAVGRAVRAEAGLIVSDAQMLQLIRVLQRELVGAGPLSDLLADPATTDVVVNGPKDVRVDRGSGWEQTDITFVDDAAVQRLARRLALAVDRRLDDAQPFVDAQLADGSRFHAVLAPLAASGTSLSLRVLRPSVHTLDSLNSQGTFPGSVLAVLRAVLTARLALIVSGGTGSGKTTLLNALLSAVPGSERIVTVEDASELRPDHPHVVRLVARTDNVEGAGRIDMRELVRQAMRMRPDRLAIGEVRGGEVVDLLSALNTGHGGGGGTVHANSVAEVPARMEALGAVGGLERHALHAQLAGAIQVVVHMRRNRSGRAVAEIGVLKMAGSGLVVPATVIDGDGRPTELAGLLSRLLRDREVEVPW